MYAWLYELMSFKLAWVNEKMPLLIIDAHYIPVNSDNESTRDEFGTTVYYSEGMCLRRTGLR